MPPQREGGDLAVGVTVAERIAQMVMPQDLEPAPRGPCRVPCRLSRSFGL